MRGPTFGTDRPAARILPPYCPAAAPSYPSSTLPPPHRPTTTPSHPPQGSAPMDSDARRISLKHGSDASRWWIHPRFKAQTEGSSLYYGYSFKLESANLERMYLHTSPTFPYSEVTNADDTMLPRCLRTGLACEVNLSASFSTYTISKYNRVEDRTALPIGAPFRLYHSQAESFLTASCDPDKGKALGRSRREQINARRGDGPCHIPYLNRLADEGTDPDPANPDFQSAKGVWVLEDLTRSG